MKSISLALLILALSSAANWAVLVCGSRSMGNYRHHADMYSFYHTLHLVLMPTKLCVLAVFLQRILSL